MSFDNQRVQNAICQAKRLLYAAGNGGIPDCLKKLVYHERNKRITYKRKGHSKSFWVDYFLIYNGISKRLKSTFWKHHIAPSKPDLKSHGKEKKRTSNGCYSGGKTAAHGRKVHEDMERIIRAIRLPLQKNGGVPYVSKVDPCAYRMFLAMLKRGWIPVKSEFCIFDEYLRIATAVDCIAWDVHRKRAVLIEIKTGHDSQTDYEATTGKIRLLEPLAQVPDSPLNRAAIQLLVSLLMIQRRYGIQFDDGAIIRPRSRNNDVQIYNLPKWILLPGIQRSIYARLNETIGQTEQLFARRPASKEKRDKIELLELTQKAIEAAPDPHEEIVWSPKPISVHCHITSTHGNNEEKTMNHEKNNTSEKIDQPTKSITQDLFEQFNECVNLTRTRQYSNSIDSLYEKSVNTPEIYTGLYIDNSMLSVDRTSIMPNQTQQETLQHSNIITSRKRRRCDGVDKPIKMMKKIAEMDTSWAKELEKMGF